RHTRFSRDWSSDVCSSDLDRDYKLLRDVLKKYETKRIIFLGDLFHSSENAAWLHFIDFSSQYPHTELILIKGNHDILPLAYYQRSEERRVGKEGRSRVTQD